MILGEDTAFTPVVVGAATAKKRRFIMQILVEVPASLSDAIQCTPQQFIKEAKLAMGITLFEMKRLSSGRRDGYDGIV